MTVWLSRMQDGSWRMMQASLVLYGNVSRLGHEACCATESISLVSACMLIYQTEHSFRGLAVGSKRWFPVTMEYVHIQYSFYVSMSEDEVLEIICDSGGIIT
jgi:hypothetical protein